jgi:hypothetical protein
VFSPNGMSDNYGLIIRLRISNKYVSVTALKQ